ncbi:hypothetical protein [Enterococcus raffinosus]
MKYLTANKIMDSNGKVWFVRDVKEYFPEIKILIAVAEKWVTDYQAIGDRSRIREIETIEVPFKEIQIKTEPFERIVNIIF